MGFVILFSGILTEILFLIYCIKTNDLNIKIKRIVRFTTPLLFILISLFNIIEWGVRYYTLAIFLIFQAFVELLRIKKSAKPFVRKKVVKNFIVYTLMFFISLLPSIIFPQYKPIIATGKYVVETTSYTYTDVKRLETYNQEKSNRQLNVQFWYPKNTNEKLPLVLFSHGAYGVRSSNESLYNELASHGYVVCSIDHTYQCFFTTLEDEKTIYMDKGYANEVKTENALIDKQKSYSYYEKWMKIRTADINFVLDEILLNSNKISSKTPYSLIDIAKIGVMGHSLGGSAALGVGRMRNDVKAVISLESPFLCDIKGIEKNEFIFETDDYPIPILNFYSDSSWNILGKRPQYAENYRLLSTLNKNVHNYYLRGVGHLGLTDFALTSPILTNIFDGKNITIDNRTYLKKINKACLDFFNFYLKNKGAFQIAE